MPPLVSVVTVVKDAEKVLEATILSVLAQTYSRVEYIVVDGASTDGTLALIGRYQERLARWVSEPDDGLFDAMNRGISLCSGEWVIFMNAGDEFHTPAALGQIDLQAAAAATIVYGDYVHGGTQVRPLDVAALRAGIIFDCHQAMLFNRSRCGQDLRYDTRYPTYADYELVLRLYLRHPDTFVYVPVMIARYLGGGVSSTRVWRKRLDTLKIVGRHLGLRGLGTVARDRLGRMVGARSV